MRNLYFCETVFSTSNRLGCLSDLQVFLHHSKYKTKVSGKYPTLTNKRFYIMIDMFEKSVGSRSIETRTWTERVSLVEC